MLCQTFKTNVHNFANKKEGCKNTLINMENGFGVHIQPENISNSASCGDVCLSINSDGENSYITADNFRFLKEYVGNSDFGVTQESFLFDFRESGSLPNSEIGVKPTTISLNLNLLTNEKLDSLCEEYSKYPFANSSINKLSLSK